MALVERYASSAGGGANNGTSEADAWSFVNMIAAGGASAGHRVNFKGNHSLGVNSVIANAGSATSPIIIRGYKTVPGDLSYGGALYGGRTYRNGPLVTSDIPVITCAGYTLGGSALNLWQDMAITSTYNGNAFLLGTNSFMAHCKVSNTGTGAAAYGCSIPTQSCAFDCDFEFAGASGGLGGCTGAGYFVHCRATASGAVTGRCFDLTTGTVCVNCVAHSAIGDGFYGSNAANTYLLVNCSSIGNGSDGFHQITGATRISFIINSLLTDCGAYGIYAVQAAAAIAAPFNRIARNTTAASSGATDWLTATDFGRQVTADPVGSDYEDYAGKNFNLVGVSPGRAAGSWPWFDLGALQRQEPQKVIRKRPNVRP